MRRFELRSPTEHKVWSVTHPTEDHGHGFSVQIRWGKVGGLQQFHTRVVDSAAYDALIKKQRALGYVEVTEAAEVLATVTPNERWSRRFERGDELFELTLDGASITQRSGSIDPDDRQPNTFSTATHATAAEARDVVERVIAARTRDGFVLVEQRPDRIAATRHSGLRWAPSPALEAQCRAAPDDPGPWAVYADWLMAHGDLRGELAALRAGGRETEAAQLCSANALELFDGNPEVASAVRLTSWRHGFPIAAGIRLRDSNEGDLTAIAHALLAMPIATFVRSLVFGLAGFSDANDWAPTLAAVVDSPIGSQIRELRFDDYTYEDCELSWVPFGDFSTAWPRLSQLETLAIRSGAGGTLGTIELPALRRFERISGGLSTPELHSIVNARWPKLEHLEIWTGSANYGAQSSVADLTPVFDATGLPALRHLGIVNSELVDDVIELLATSRLLPQLRTLDLSKGVMAERGTRRLVEHAAAFRHLQWIDLSENLLVPEEVVRLVRALPKIRTDKQRQREDVDEGNDEGDRYVAVGE